MKHIELLNLICRYKQVIDDGYRNKKLQYVDEKLVEVGLFYKIGELYYINDSYVEFVNTLLNRADLNYIIEDFSKEVKRLIELKENYLIKKDNFTFKLINSMILKIYQGLQNRDKNILSLIESLENDKISDLDILINEAKRVLSEIEESINTNELIIKTLDEIEKIEEFKNIIFSVIYDIIILNQNIDGYLKRIREFIHQTEQKRRYNQKLFKLSTMILEESTIVDNLLASKDFAYKFKVDVVADKLNRKKLKSFFSKLYIDRESKKTQVKTPIEEVVRIIDINALIKELNNSQDIFSDVLEYLKDYPEFISEALRVYVYIINHYDKNIVYTNEYNKYNVRIVKWK